MGGRAARHPSLLQLKLVGTPRDRRGGTAKEWSAGGALRQTVGRGSSYCSASNLALIFGLGKDVSAARQKLTNVAADKRLLIQER